MQYFVFFWQNDIQSSMEWSGTVCYPLRARLKGVKYVCAGMLQLVFYVFDYSVFFLFSSCFSLI